MKNYFIWADPHLGHHNILIHCSRLPWLYPNPNYDSSKPKHFKYNNEWSIHLNKHDNAIIDNHNNLVKQGDTVIILGDFAWRDHNKYLARLNGKHIMVLGNHDKMNQDSLRNFSEVHEFGCRKKLFGWDITFCHYALRSWPGSYRNNSLSCWAHSHGRMPEFDNMLACDGGVDVWGYGVLPLDVFIEKMQRKIKWINKNGKYAVDGENKAEGQYDKDPEVRVIETRKKNKEIMKSLGYPIIEEMWPNT